MYKTIDDIKLNLGRKHKIIQAKVNWSPKHKDDLIQGAVFVELPNEYVAWSIFSHDNGESFNCEWGSYSVIKTDEAFAETWHTYQDKVRRICP